MFLYYQDAKLGRRHCVKQKINEKNNERNRKRKGNQQQQQHLKRKKKKTIPDFFF